MDEKLYKLTLYDKVYIFCKSLILLIISSILILITQGIIIPLLTMIMANFIINDFSYSKELFEGINIKTIILSLIYVFIFNLIIFIDLNMNLIYTDPMLSICRGINTFVLIEFFLSLSYITQLIRYKNESISKAFMHSLLIVNYKIGLSLIMISFLSLIGIILIIVFKGQLILLWAILIFIWQLSSTYIFKKIVLEVKE